MDPTGDGDGDDPTGDGDGDDPTGDGDGDGDECAVDEDCADIEGPCTLGVCVMGSCEAQVQADDTPCSSGDLCLVDEVCSAGECVGGAAKDCSGADDDCNTGVCDPDSGACVGEPINEGEACTDDDLCSLDTVCTAGVCGGGMQIDCSEFDDACNVGVCDPNSGECAGEPANEGEPCDDDNSCTYADVCGGGICAGSSEPLFSDDFAVDLGWTAEGKWQIGVAQASPEGSLSGLSDPDADHSPTDDEMLAGVLIGGLSTAPGHDADYLTSPVIDLSVLDPAATVEFRYYRWLVSSVAFMTDTIDVWDGAQWVNVYTAALDMNDAAWGEVVIDVSSYKNADFQVRFGHAYNDIPVGPSEPSWSVDDVEIVPVCP
ncbi:MAG: hypothetical protein R6X02_00195 [Enhygromyxa sp.]